MEINSTDDAYDVVSTMTVAFTDLFKSGVVSKEDGEIMLALSRRITDLLDMIVEVAERKATDDQ